MAIRIPPKTNQDAIDTTAALQAAGEAPTADDVTVEAGTDGLGAGSVQEALQALATRVAALETPEA